MLSFLDMLLVIKTKASCMLHSVSVLSDSSNSNVVYNILETTSANSDITTYNYQEKTLSIYK